MLSVQSNCDGIKECYGHNLLPQSYTHISRRAWLSCLGMLLYTDLTLCPGVNIRVVGVRFLIH
jgi:hypothetical protein